LLSPHFALLIAIHKPPKGGADRTETLCFGSCVRNQRHDRGAA
jgi:hypothetical protein